MGTEWRFDNSVFCTWGESMIRVLLISSIFIIISSTANAQHSNWVDQLLNKDNVKCCSNNDGERLGGPDWDNLGKIENDFYGNSGYRVWEDGRWYDVPNRAMVTGKNLDGIARVWWSREYINGQVTRKTVRCFLRGVEG